ncbi:MAG: imidazole glycerol phosphate synthase subunit HisH [Acidimicrobiaceae bacterium]|nr:imidazole glycerol phosphate synthase subunit HisH [Acidimicrobiaceae bacterium]MBO0746848.1 imidazole glycerol phosphate synthase subunit HisH [Acidimicrobiaceae bacterium]
MIAVLDYGIGNLRSAEKALQHLGGDALLVSDPEVAAAAGAVVLPGVGNFGRCLEALRASRLDGVAIEAATDGRPFLGICVGMQMLYEASEESPGVAGLGILPGTVRRLPAGVKRPQMQWNRLDPAGSRPDGAGSPLEGLDLGGPDSEGTAWAYFVHSYACPPGPEVVATCDYGGPVTAAIARGPLWATQFHPEKSSTAGLAVLGNFVRAAARARRLATPAR